MSQHSTLPTHPGDAVAADGFLATRNFLANTPFKAFAPALERWFVEDLARVYRQVEETDSGFFTELLDRLKMRYTCAPDDIQRIPSTGPVMIVSNHPFGLPEGVILGALLADVRRDVRFLANSMLASIPQLREWVIPVNPYGGVAAIRENRGSIRRSIEWLRDGGLLVVFPAGEVSSLQLPHLRIADPAWTDNVARLARLTNASVMPVFFHGGNGAAFHLAGLIHARLRTLLLPRELLNKAGTKIHVSIGTPISAERLVRAVQLGSATEYLRGRTHLLGARTDSEAGPGVQPRGNGMMPRRQAKVIEQQNPLPLDREVQRLPAHQRLLRSGEYLVCLAAAAQIPQTLREIGRLREITFRQAGEGTGAAVDLDRFDRHYSHLWVRNEERREVVGAYRLAHTDSVIERFGVKGLYTGTLFHLRPDFYAAVGPALELGRSFVRPEYQKDYLPLMLLWKGLGHYVAAHPQYRRVFGPVSISKEYTSSSRALMVSFLKARYADAGLTGYVQPRKQYRVRGVGDCDASNFSTLLENLGELSELVSDLESDHKGIPVVLRHYLNLGGRILDFSVDPNFANVLDGLIVIDLAQTGRKHLERYMGKENAEQFLQLHAVL